MLLTTHNTVSMNLTGPVAVEVIIDSNKGLWDQCGSEIDSQNVVVGRDSHWDTTHAATAMKGVVGQQD